MRFDGLWRNKLKTKQANRQTKSPKTQTQKSSSIHWWKRASSVFPGHRDKWEMEYAV